MRLQGGVVAVARDVGVAHPTIVAELQGRPSLGLVTRARLEERLGAPQGVPDDRIVHVFAATPPFTDLVEIAAWFWPGGAELGLAPWSLAPARRGRPSTSSPRRPQRDVVVIHARSATAILRCPRGVELMPQTLGTKFGWRGGARAQAVLALPPSLWTDWSEGPPPSLADLLTIWRAAPPVTEAMLRDAAAAAGWSAADALALLEACAQSGLSADQVIASVRRAGRSHRHQVQARGAASGKGQKRTGKT